MTVKELIERLEQYPPDTKVAISSDHGYDEPRTIEVRRIYLDYPAEDAVILQPW